MKTTPFAFGWVMSATVAFATVKLRAVIIVDPPVQLAQSIPKPNVPKFGAPFGPVKVPEIPFKGVPVGVLVSLMISVAVMSVPLNANIALPPVSAPVDTNLFESAKVTETSTLAGVVVSCVTVTVPNGETPHPAVIWQEVKSMEMA